MQRGPEFRRGAGPARARRTRPRDAASLVLTRGRGRDAEVLLGRREPTDRFMPDVYVFPGGRVDRGDASLPAASELRAPVAAALAAHAGGARGRALAVAAVRETFEETGLLLGRRAGATVSPDLRRLVYVARAITPTASPIRYHARFFQADAAALSGRLRGSGELLDLAWLPIPRALELPIIDVTGFVLHEVARRLSGRSVRGLPLCHYRGTELRVRRD
jgi:8-oxo-dGTP pyrophosphatase MutT (NUDIX family)